VRFLTPIVAVCTLGVVGGCSSSSADDSPSKLQTGAGKPLNPGGKPQTAQDAAYANQMQKVGDAMNAQRDKDAAAMAAARAHAGGH